MAHIYAEIWKDAAPAHLVDVAVFCDSNDTHTGTAAELAGDVGEHPASCHELDRVRPPRLGRPLRVALPQELLILEPRSPPVGAQFRS